MKKYITLSFVFLSSLMLLASPVDLKKDFVFGNPEVSSINAMTFGPEGILFMGDSQTANVIAVDLSAHPKMDNEKVKINQLDQQIADLLGAGVDQVQITDMVVNPENQNIYLSVQHSSGKAILFRVVGTTLEEVPLSNISYSKTPINHVLDESAEDRRGRKLRKWTVSDIHYADGKVMLSGLSDKEFASTFRTISFPFDDQQNDTSLEIYHAAHGKYETHAPIKTFTTTQLNGKPYLIAGYTCTPLVVFPLGEITPGEHTKGQTVAELGNWNTPLDIIEMEKDSKRYMLLANTNRALMKIKVEDVESFNGSLNTKVAERAATAGIDFINLPFVNVQQLAKLSDQQFLMIQRDANGDLVLKTGGNRWL